MQNKGSLQKHIYKPQNKVFLHILSIVSTPVSSMFSKHLFSDVVLERSIASRDVYQQMLIFTFFYEHFLSFLGLKPETQSSFLTSNTTAASPRADEDHVMWWKSSRTATKLSLWWDYFVSCCFQSHKSKCSQHWKYDHTGWQHVWLSQFTYWICVYSSSEGNL